MCMVSAQLEHYEQNYTAGPILLTNRPGPFFPEWPSRNFADRAILEKMALSAPRRAILEKMALSVKFREGHSGKNGPVSKIQKEREIQITECGLTMVRLSKISPAV